MQLGASIGATDAYAAFIQETDGAARLYVAHAAGGVFGQPALADAGSPVTFAALAGSRASAGAVVVFEQEIDGKGVIFSRRLSGATMTPEERVSFSGTDAEIVRGGTVPFDRNHAIAMNEAGAAVLCWRDLSDQNNIKSFAAVLPAGAESWALHEIPKGCIDPGIDNRGNAAVLGQDMATIVITRIVAGELDEDPTEDNGMDQWTLEVSPGGQAMAQGRDKDFHVSAHYKADIAEGGDWQKTPNVEEGIIQDGANPEDPFSALDSQGDGLLVFRDNKMDAEQGYYRAITGGLLGDGGTLSQSMSRQRLAIDENSHPLVVYTDEDAGRAVFHRFNAGVPGAALPLGPDLDPSFGPNISGIASNAAGDFLALVNEGDTLQAVFGDFVPPTLTPSAAKRVRAGKPLRLRSGARDSLGLEEVIWRLPRGVKGKRTRRGASIRTRFKRKGRYTVTVSAADRAGNSTTQPLTVRVRAAKRRRG